MRDYAKVVPTFWTGKTGKALRAKGNETLIVGMYLMTAPHSNMLGLYYLPLIYIAHETGLGIEGASKGLQGAIEAGFCSFDEASEMVWVHEMAFFQIATELKPADKRCMGIQKDFDNLPNNPFSEAFLSKYKAAFHLLDARAIEAPSKPLTKPLRSQEQEQEQDIEQEGGESASASAPVPRTQSPDGSPPPFLPEFKKFIETERPDLDAAVTFANFSEHFPPEKHTPANWRKWVRREHPGLVGQPGTSGPPTVADPDSRASVEALGVSLGLGKWVQLNEHWAPYAARVKAMASQGVAA